MFIKPYSAHLAPESNAAVNFPNALLYFHWDDVIDGQTTAWVDRLGVAQLIPGTAPDQAEFIKDADGVNYTGASGIAQSIGTPIPIEIGYYYTLVAIGHNTSGSGIVGITGLVGENSAGDALTCTGLVTDAGSALNTQPALTIAASNSAGCQISCFDFAAGSVATPDRVVRIMATADENHSAIGDSTSNLAFPALSLADTLLINGFASSDDRRTKVFALLKFATNP
jgi:hypothetical protein